MEVKSHFIQKGKGSFTMKGLQQIKGVGYTENFALVVEFMTTLLFLEFSAHVDLGLCQIDVVKDFMNCTWGRIIEWGRLKGTLTHPSLKTIENFSTSTKMLNYGLREVFLRQTGEEKSGRFIAGGKIVQGCTWMSYELTYQKYLDFGIQSPRLVSKSAATAYILQWRANANRILSTEFRVSEMK